MLAEDFLSLARTLKDIGTEAASRTSVSRSYYAAVHFAARVLPREMGPFPADHDFHQAVADAVYESLRSKGTYDKVLKLREKRRDADYDLDSPLPSWLPGQMIAVADEVIKTLAARFSST